MLFSNSETASFINANFEPVWSSVRPVPVVHLDFGNDSIVTRTLHGNVATYVCFDDGCVFDVLPGVYAPETYERELVELCDAYRSVSGRNRASSVRKYHSDALDALAEAPPVRLPTPRDILDIRNDPSTLIDTPEDLIRLGIMEKDTQLNELVCRPKIHAHLKEKGAVLPSDMTKWLYREVLETDLDDPLLGLGETLFRNYPFRAEDLADVRSGESK